MAFNLYPYSDFHELNLDWIIRKIKELTHAMTDFEALNKITFSGAWDITKQYPAWTIVNDNGAGYISIRPVPAGALLTDNTYWRGVVDYTATIADLQNRVINLENDMTTVQGNITTINNSITAINNRLKDKLKGRRFVILTDSYGEIVDNFAGQLPNYLPLTPNDNYFVFAYPSRGIKGGNGADGYDFYTPFSSDYSVVTNRDTITDFIILCGANDWNVAYNVIQAKMAELCGFIKTQFPNAVISIGNVGFTITPSYFPNVLQVSSYYMQYAAENGVTFIANAENWFHYTNWMSDAVHPSATGSRLIAQNLADYILNGYSHGLVNYKAPIQFTWSGFALNFSSRSVTTQTSWINNGRIGFETTPLNLSGGAVTLPIDTSWLEMGTLSETFYQGGDPQDVESVYIEAVDTSNIKYTLLGYARVYNGKLEVQIFPASGTTSIANIKAVFVMGFKTEHAGVEM